MYVRGYLQGSENGRVVTIAPPPPPPEVEWSVPFDKIKAVNGIQQRSYISFFWSGVCVFLAVL